MKSLIVAAALATSASAFATTAVFHDYDAVLKGIKLNNACVTESTVESINPVKVCTKMEAHTTGNPNSEAGSHTDWICTKWETKDLSYPRAYSASVCLKYAPINEQNHGQCLKWGTKEGYLPDTIKVRTEVTNGEATSSKVTYFTFPGCE